MTSRTMKLIVACVVAMSSAASAQQQPTEEEKAKMAAAHYELAKPGPEHQQIAALAGKWDLEVKYWMAPGQQPMSFKGKAENKMILGGRFLISEAKSGEGQMTVESTTIIGFDRRSKKYTTVGLDTMGTYWVTAAGPYDESKKAIVMYGEDVDPALGHTQKYYFVTRIISPDKYTTEIIFKDSAHTRGAAEFKAVEITHTRAK
ncbi:MAG TPA: DUF1579 domain-containing protein [Blastocatellia bacterium]|nr:DUF1579 domain-containing protein [Blastocatellia bacterium]